MWNDAGRGGRDGPGLMLWRGFLAGGREDLDSESDSESEYCTRGISSDEGSCCVDGVLVSQMWGKSKSGTNHRLQFHL